MQLDGAVTSPQSSPDQQPGGAPESPPSPSYEPSPLSLEKAPLPTTPPSPPPLSCSVLCRFCQPLNTVRIFSCVTVATGSPTMSRIFSCVTVATGSPTMSRILTALIARSFAWNQFTKNPIVRPSLTAQNVNVFAL